MQKDIWKEREESRLRKSKPHGLCAVHEQAVLNVEDGIGTANRNQNMQGNEQKLRVGYSSSTKVTAERAYIIAAMTLREEDLSDKIVF